MNQDPVLHQLVEASLVKRTQIWKIGGWSSVVSGLGFFAVVFAMPTKPGEEGIVACFGAFAALLVGLGVMLLRSSKSQAEAVRELVYRAPNRIRSISVLVLKRGQNLHIPTVQIVDDKGKTHGLIMPDEQAARQVCERTMT